MARLGLHLVARLVAGAAFGLGAALAAACVAEAMRRRAAAAAAGGQPAGEVPRPEAEAVAAAYAAEGSTRPAEGGAATAAT
jgi:hypothetical protein